MRSSSAISACSPSPTSQRKVPLRPFQRTTSPRTHYPSDPTIWNDLYEERASAEGIESSQTRRWRKRDSNPRSRPPLFLSERSIPVRPTGALERFHSRLGRRPVSAY